MSVLPRLLPRYPPRRPSRRPSRLLSGLRLRHCARIAVALLSLLLVADWAGPAGALAQEEPSDARRGALSGRVTAEGGEPLPAVNVEVPALERGTLTDSDGRYRIEGLPARSLRVRFSRIGYGTETRSVEVARGAVRTLDVRLGIRAVVSRDITVTGTPTASDPLEVPQEIDVVGSDRMRAAGSSSLGEVLTEEVTGVSSISTGSQVGKPVLRGLSGNRVSVLQDGISQEFFQYGVRHSPPTSMTEAERVEVVRGPASVLYGSDALGGAVNVITKSPPAAPAGETHAGGQVAGSLRTGSLERSGSADLHVARGPVGLRAGVERRVADELSTPEAGTFFEEGGEPGAFGPPKYSGQIPFTNFEQLSAYGQVGVQGAAGSAQLSVDRWDNRQNFLLPVGGPAGSESNPPVGLGQSLEGTNVEASGTLSPGAFTLEPTLAYQRAVRQAGGPGSTFGEEPDWGIDLRKDVYTGRLLARHAPAGPFEGTVGVEASREETDSEGPVELEPSSEITNVAAFAFEEWSRERLTVTGGLRLDHREQEAAPNERTAEPELLRRSFTEVTGALGANVRLGPVVSLASNANVGFRAPSIFELYADGVHGGVAAVQLGTPTLEPERALTVDLSLRANTSRFRGKLTAYRNTIDDYIYLENTGETDGEGLPFFRAAQTDARVLGVEGQGAYTAASWLRLGGSFSFLDGRGEGLGDPGGAAADGGAGDGPLPLLPADRLEVFAELRPGGSGLPSLLSEPSLRVEVERALDKEAAAPIEPFSQFDATPFGTASTRGYTVIDVEAETTLEIGTAPLSLTLRVENLTDRAYRAFLDTYKGYALSPGRSLTTRVSVPFELAP